MFQRYKQYVVRSLSGFAEIRRGLWGATILRVGFSLIALANYVWHVTLWQALWGPRAEMSLDLYRRFAFWHFAPYAASSVVTYSAALYIASIVFTILFAIGFLPRITCWLFLAASYATYSRTALATDAGQQLMILLLFLMCLMDTGAHLSLSGPKTFKSGRLFYGIGTMLHNAARFLVTWQMCMVYFWAAFWKLGGADWRNGTAMYYVMHIERFAVWPWFSNLLTANAVVVVLMTYSTLAIQLAFPFLIWNERAKPYITALMVTLHVGIAFTLGLVSFSAIMIVADLSLLSDAQLRAFGDFLIRSVRAPRGVLGSKVGA